MIQELKLSQMIKYIDVCLSKLEHWDIVRHGYDPRILYSRSLRHILTYKTWSRVRRVLSYSQGPMCEYVWRKSWDTIVVQHTESNVYFGLLKVCYNKP